MNRRPRGAEDVRYDPAFPDEADVDGEFDDAEGDAAYDELDAVNGSVTPGSLDLTPGLAVPLRPMLLVATIGLAEGASIIAGALLMRAAIDQLVQGVVPGTRVVTLLGGLVLTALISAALRSLEFGVSEAIGYRYVARVRMAMFRHLLGTSTREMQRSSMGGVLLRFMGDLTAIRTWVSRGIARGMVSCTILLLGVLALALMDVRLAPVALGILLVGTGLSLREGTEVRRSWRDARRQRANLATNLADQVRSLAVVQSMGRLHGEASRFDRQNVRLTRHLLRYANVRATLRAVSGATASLAAIGVLAVGSLDITAGRATIGGVIAAMLVARQLARPIRTLGLSLEYWQTGRVSREKILRFLSRPRREADTVGLTGLRVGRGRLEFRDVHLGGALHGLSGVVPPGRVLALFGPNGAGKSSLLSLVARIADPDRGEVVLDGQSLAACTLSSCAARISMMGPALPLVRGSLRRNLLYRWPTAPEAELERVIRLCHVDEVIARLDGGLDGAIKEGGSNLSSGEAARVALARALVGAPKILLLDEPTVNLDEETRRAVHQIITHYAGTVIIATNDRHEAALADTVWRMDGGRIVEVVEGDAFRETALPSPPLPAWARADDRR